MALLIRKTTEDDGYAVLSACQHERQEGDIFLNDKMHTAIINWIKTHVFKKCPYCENGKLEYKGLDVDNHKMWFCGNCKTRGI